MPEIERTILKRDKLPDEPYIPPSLRDKVYLQKDSFKTGISSVTGFPYVQYRLVYYKPPGKRRKPAYVLNGNQKREVYRKKQHKNDGECIRTQREEVP